MLDIILAVLFGAVLGALAGLLPGIHPNSMVPIILGASAFLDPVTASVILVSAGVVNSFVSFLPSVFIGAPEENTVLSVLPGHRLLLDGRGEEAVRLAVIGGLGSIFFIALTLPFFSFLMPQAYSLIRPKMHLILILAVVFLLMKERNKLSAALVFVLSGVLGYFVLGMGNFALFPLLSGLFGLPLIILSIKDKIEIPESKKPEDKLEKRGTLGGICLGAISGVIAGLLPGLGSTQSMLISEELAGGKRGTPPKKFMVALGAVSMADMIYSLFSIWLIGNPRSGIAVGVKALMDVGQKEAVLFLFVVFAASAIGAVMTIFLSKKMLVLLKKIEYKNLCISVLAFILVSVFFFSGIEGIAILLLSLSVGMLPNLLNVRRTNCMGCLIVPTIVYFATL